MARRSAAALSQDERVRDGVSWSRPVDADELTSYELADEIQEEKGEEKGRRGGFSDQVSA